MRGGLVNRRGFFAAGAAGLPVLAPSAWEKRSQDSQWAILALMGHTRKAGVLTPVEVGGMPFMRLDVPNPDGGYDSTEFFSPGAIYSFQVVSEEKVMQFVRARNASVYTHVENLDGRSGWAETVEVDRW